MAVKDKKFYYLKLFDDFFERDEIQIIEGMPNGKEYVLFYLKLLCKSIKMLGILRVNELIPYDAAMLASLTKTNIDIVKGAIDAFVAFGLMSIYDNGTIYMEQIEKLMGTESYWAERKRIQRAETQENEQLPEPLDNVQQLSSECPHILDIDIDIEKDIEIDTEIEKKEPDADASGTRVPYQDIVDLYHNICISYPKLRTVSESRKRAIKARYKEFGNDISTFEELFRMAEESDFLAGRSRDWQASFDWLMKPANAAKVLEGNYKNKSKGGKANGSNNPFADMLETGRF